MRARRLVVALAVLATLAAARPAAAPAFVLSAAPPSARTQLMLNLGTATFVSIDGPVVSFNQIAQRALADWNAVGVGPFEDHAFFSSRVTSVPARCDPDGINVVAFGASNCGQGWGDALAVSHLWVSGGKIIQADVIFNANARWDSYAGPLRTQAGVQVFDFYRIALHEFGHVAGLDHAPLTVPAIMQGRAGDIDRLQPDDIAGAHAVQYSPYGPDALIAVSPDTLDFGIARVGGEAIRTFTAQNLGGSVLLGVAVPSAPFQCLSGCTYTLGVGETAAVTIQFAPPTVGAFTGSVFFSGGGNSVVAVGGTGVVSVLPVFIGNLYANVLGRAPTAAEVAQWSAFLAANPNLDGASGIVHAIFDGAEYRQRPATPWSHVYLLFLSVLGRAPGADELGAWTTDLIARLDSLLPLFTGSQEFRNLVPDVTDPAAAAAAVTRLYQQTLGRAPSAAELANFTGYLVATGDMLGVAQAVFGSVEYLGAPRTLAQRVTAMFRALLARDPLPAEVDYFAGVLASRVADMETAFIASPESQARFLTLFE